MFFAYARVLLWEFRWTLVLTVVAVAIAAFANWITHYSALGGQRPTAMVAIYGGWTALFGEPIYGPPENWYLLVIDSIYPLLGFALIGEGIVHLGMLMVSRRRGEKEWMKVMASTFRNHVILCGMGRLGIRVLEQLLEQGRDVVVVEKDEAGAFVSAARATGAPVLIRDMTEDQALIDAGIATAQSIIVGTNNDVANLEVALDARRLNPKIHISLRLFDQRVAEKLSTVFDIDHAFSSSALAAPAVAGMTLGVKVLSACKIGGVQHVAAEITIGAGAALVGQSVAELERRHNVRLLSRAQAAETPLAAGEAIVVHGPLEVLSALKSAAAAASA